MGACRRLYPAGQAWRQPAPRRCARGDEWDHVRLEHGMPMAGDSEGFADRAARCFTILICGAGMERSIVSITRSMWGAGSRMNGKPAQPPPSSIAKA